MSQDKRYSRIFPAKKEHFPNKDQRVIAVFLHFEALSVQSESMKNLNVKTVPKFPVFRSQDEQ